MERAGHLTSLRVKSVLGEGLINCARKLDPHQEIQVIAELKPNFYPLPRRGGVNGVWNIYAQLLRIL